jgi:cyclohexa-1,5-dienecarbonyl-CoA hydratase
VQLLAPPGALETAVADWFATYFAPKSAAALRHAVAAARMTLQTRVGEVLPKLERLYLDELMRTHDAVEGIDAFLARRRPVWRNE